MQRRVALPSSLVIGVVSSFAGSAAFTMSALAMTVKSDDGEASFEAMIRWSLFGSATAIAGLVLVTAALFAIADRVSGVSRTLLLIAGWIQIGYMAWWLAQPFLLEFLGETMVRLYEGWLSKVLSLLFWSASVLVTVAARAWWRPVTAWVTVAAVVLVLFEAMTWIPFLPDALEHLGEHHPYAARLIWPVREALTGGALLVVVYGILRDAPAALPSPDRAAAWLRRAGASLMVRVVAAIALAVLSIGIVKSPGAMKLVLFVGPVVTVLAVFGLSWSLLGVERAQLPAMPGLRLVLGAALIALSAGLQVNQLRAAFRMLSDRGAMYAQHEGEMWSVIGPLIGITGMVLACSAVVSWAGKLGNHEVREMAIARAIVHAVLSGLVLAMPLALGKATSTGAILAIALLGALAAIVSVVVVATVFNRAAAAIQPSPSLPEARLR